MATSPNPNTSGVANYLGKRKLPSWPSWQYLLFAWPFAGMAFLGSFTAWKDAVVAPRQSLGAATITGYDRPNHNQCRYSFIIAGKVFNGESASSGVENPPLGSIQTVYYDTMNPGTNSLLNYEAESVKERTFVIVLFEIDAIIFAIIGVAKLRNRFDLPRR